MILVRGVILTFVQRRAPLFLVRGLAVPRSFAEILNEKGGTRHELTAILSRTGIP